MRRAAGIAFLLTFALAETSIAQAPPSRPRGIYAIVNIEDNINTQTKANSSITTAQLDASFNGLYQGLFANAAVSGLALQVHWDTLNPNPPASAASYFWNYVDDAFNQAAVWNTQNPTQTPKTIQLLVTPGFNSPQWMLDQLTSCDGLFQTPAVTPPSTCGTATFLGFQEGGDGTVLPLPWNPVYKNAWQTFLTALAARYGPNQEFVSIAVDGPTAASAEMIVPNDSNSNNPQTQFGAAITPSNMWIQLLTFHYAGQAAYQKTNQAFIDEWNNAIDMFGQVFKGITLVATTGNGFPNFTGATVTIPPAFAVDCAVNPDLDCAAETTILAHFVQPSVGGANAKATQTSGMAAARVNNANLGVPGVKQLSQTTAQLTSPSAQILGGSQFNTTFSIATLPEGCTSTFPPNASDTPVGCSIPPSCTTNGCIPVACIPQACLAPGVTNIAGFKTFSNVPAADLIPPEQALYNVLSVFFNGTPAAAYFDGTTGTAPLNYLQIYSPDIQYATANASAPAQVVAGSVTVSITAQGILNQANAHLLAIGEPSPAILPGGIVPVASPLGMIQAGEWISIYGSNLAIGIANWTGNYPTSLAGTSVTIDGKSAYLNYVSPGLIEGEAPSDMALGSVAVVVTTGFGTAMANVILAQASPSFLLLDGKHVAGYILRFDGSGAYGGGTYDLLGPTGSSLGYGTVAAKAGDSVVIFGTGFGPTSPAVPAGQAFAGSAATTNQVTLSINNMTVTPSFAGLSGPGVDQFNVTIPAGLGTGDVPLLGIVAGLQSPSGVVIPLQ